MPYGYDGPSESLGYGGRNDLGPQVGAPSSQAVDAWRELDAESGAAMPVQAREEPIPPPPSSANDAGLPTAEATTVEYQPVGPQREPAVVTPIRPDVVVEPERTRAIATPQTTAPAPVPEEEDDSGVNAVITFVVGLGLGWLWGLHRASKARKPNPRRRRRR